MRRIIAGLLASAMLLGGMVVSSAPAGSETPDNYNDRVSSDAFQVSGTYQPLVGQTGCGESPVTLFVLWYAPGGAADYLWRLTAANSSSRTSEPMPVNGTYEPVVGDFDGDDCDDIFWYAPGAARDYVWYGNAEGGFDSKAVTVNGTYEPVVARMSEDSDDIFWYAPGSGQEYIWDGHDDRSFTSHVGPKVNGDYRIAVYATTWLFHKPGPGQDYIWGGVLAGETAPFENIPVDIDGSYVPIGGPSTIFLYGPGAAEDLAIVDIDEETGEIVTIPATVNGTYVPGITSPSAKEYVILWHGPGAASDHFWWSSI